MFGKNDTEINSYIKTDINTLKKAAQNSSKPEAMISKIECSHEFSDRAKKEFADSLEAYVKYYEKNPLVNGMPLAPADSE